MLNKIYAKIKGSELDIPFSIFMFFGGFFPLFILIMNIFEPKMHVPTSFYIIYVIGVIVSFICSAQIDYTQELRSYEKESEYRNWVMMYSFIWPAYISTGIIFGFLFLLVNLFGILNFLHTKLIGIHTKIKMPPMPKIKKNVKLKSEPLPPNGAYRTVQETCDACGKMQ